MDDEWDDALQSELRGCGSDFTAGGHDSTAQVPSKDPLKRRRGRPTGTTKLALLALQRGPEHPPLADVNSSDSAQRPSPSGGVSSGQLTLAIQQGRLSQMRSGSLASTEALTFGPKELLTSLGSSVQRTFGAALQAALQRRPSCSRSSVPEEGPVPQDTALSHILQGDVLTCSSSSVAKMTGSTRGVVQQSLLAAGSAALEGAGLLWGTMLTSLDQLRQRTKNMVPVLFCLNLRYDETPTKVRVAVMGSSGSGGSQDPGQCIIVPKVASTGEHLKRYLALQDVAPRLMPQSATHAKILQTQAELGLLYQNMAPDGSKTHVWLTGSIPCALQAMDRSTGEAQLSCVLENLQTLPELKRLAEPFKLQVRASTTDRYSANTRTEEGLKAVYPAFTSTHLACDVHRCSTSIGNMLKVCQSDISGLLNTALALSDLGSVKKLRDALTSIFFEEMDVQYSEPPKHETAEYRSQIFDLYLPVVGVVKSTQKMNRKRRFILQAMLNGYIMQPQVQHFCVRGCCRNRQETFSYVSLFLCWALVPFACPVLCRKSWIGQLGNLHFVGILEAHHGLFVKLMNKFFGKPTPPVETPAAPSDDPWLQALQDELAEAGAGAPVRVQPESAAEAGDTDARHEGCSWAVESLCLMESGICVQQRDYSLFRSVVK